MKEKNICKVCTKNNLNERFGMCDKCHNSYLYHKRRNVMGLEEFLIYKKRELELESMKGFRIKYYSKDDIEAISREMIEKYESGMNAYQIAKLFRRDYSHVKRLIRKHKAKIKRKV